MTSQNQAETVQQREDHIRNRWKQDRVFARSIEQRTEAEFVFYEGPPTAAAWELRTIREETRNCYFYEKMGYRLTGVSQPLNERATLVSYQKSVSQ